VNEQVKSRSDIVAAEASHVLAIHRLIGIDQLVNMFNACTEASRPQLVTAVTIAVGDLKDKKLLSITRDRPLYRWIAEEALGV
jgi:hypothetical protein